ncbi:leucine-rich repeat-containing protein 31 isoform X3 [Gadus chalcogrammus]|uniref:leucine-rich repeat-containing protein 31 isoform X3 n=1 Tax=Gadus chalcogrammus TaxID=1042646 RepID=UPI0024C48F6F|nr:leucine-rich repeat-containing protein 31 isoform X3 [Gadus chalcogrammus]
MDSEGQKGWEVGVKFSPLDLIMNQIRRKRSATDRKTSARFLSRSSSGRVVISDQRETDGKEGRDGASDSDRSVCEGLRVSVTPAVPEATESEADQGWGRLCLFLQRLGKKADSHGLNLAHCDLTATDLLELATLLHCLPQLEEIDLSWNNLIGGSLSSLTSHLQQVARVRTLRLCSCRLNADDIASLGAALPSVPLLEVLDVSWNVGVGGGGLQGLLGDLVGRLPKLCVLDVSGNPLLAEDTQESDTGGFGQLAASLSHAPCLSRLVLQGCGLTSHSLKSLGGTLQQLPALRELDLSCNKGLSGGLSQLTAHLALLAHLESLDLHLCNLTHADLQALIQVVPSLGRLTELDVSSNKEVGGVVHSLVSSLLLPQLRRLPLNSCSLTAESFTAFALAVPYLSSVEVSWNKVVGGRLALLLDALEPSVIKELRLSSCHLTSDDLGHLAEVCGRGLLSSLRVLDLSYNGQAAAGAEAWAPLFTAGGLGGLGSLEVMDLSLRPAASASSAAWLPSLLSSLPRLPALTHLAMLRWGLGDQAQGQLRHSLRKRALHVEWDPPTGAGGQAPPPGDQDGPEEALSEE